MLIDCDRCQVRGHGCSDCAVTALLGPPPAALDPIHARAIDVLAAAGMLAPLRLVMVETPSAHHDASEDGAAGTSVTAVTHESQGILRLVDTPPRHLPETHAVG